MTHEELNRRLEWFADLGVPYDERIWRALSRAYLDGYGQALRDVKAPALEAVRDRNPYK